MDLVVVLIVVIVVALVVGWYLVRRKNRREAPAKPAGMDPFSSADADSLHGNPRTLKPGDIITVRGQDYAARGVLRLTEGSYNWIEVFLDTGTGDRMWLSVEDDPDLEVTLWRELKSVTVAPGPRSIELDGRSYVMDESGEATFVSEGTTGLDARGSMKYHDYEAGDGTYLSFEDFSNGKWECARGEALQHSEFKIYPVNNS